MTILHFTNSNVPAITPLFPAPTAEPPEVFFSLEAELTIRYLVQEVDVEIAWFGLVRHEEESNAYVVYKILIPEQEVTGTSVDISANAVANLVNNLLQAGEDPSHLRYHGHSHVNMPVTPSSTDQEHIREYLEHSDWFIREIRNKENKRRVDVFDKRLGVVFHCVNHDIYEHLQTDDFYEAINETIHLQVSRKKLPPKTPHYQRATSYKPPQQATLMNSHALLTLSNDFDFDDDNDDILYYQNLSDPFFVKD